MLCSWKCELWYNFHTNRNPILWKGLFTPETQNKVESFVSYPWLFLVSHHCFFLLPRVSNGHISSLLTIAQGKPPLKELNHLKLSKSANIILWSHRSVTSSYRLCPARYVLHAAFPYLFQLPQRNRHHTSPTLCKASHYPSWNPWGKVCYQHIFTLMFFSLDQMKCSYSPSSLQWPRTYGFDWRISPPPSKTEVLL